MTETKNPHRIIVTIINGGHIDGEMECDAPEGAECRLWCDEGCEQAGPDHAEIHALTDRGYCVRTEGWFDDDIFGCYAGSAQPLRSGGVILEFEGDGYLWYYDAPASHDSTTTGEQ